MRNHAEIPSSEYLGRRQLTTIKVGLGSNSMAKTNGMFIVSDPWVFNEDSAHQTINGGSMPTSPKQLFKSKKKTLNNIGFSQTVGNPNEIELDPAPSFGHKTGMQAILSEVID